MSAISTIVVSHGDPTPPYEQLRRQLEELILSGSLAGGTRLPTVRQLANDLALAAGTVARTYKELEAAHLVQTRRSAGTRVSDTLNQPPNTADLVARYAHEYLTRVRSLGLKTEDAVRAITQASSLPTSDQSRRHAESTGPTDSRHPANEAMRQ